MANPKEQPRVQPCDPGVLPLVLCTADANYDLKNNQPSETPTANHAIMRFKLTILIGTIVPSSERLAIANLCYLHYVIVYLQYIHTHYTTIPYDTR